MQSSYLAEVTNRDVLVTRGVTALAAGDLKVKGGCVYDVRCAVEHQVRYLSLSPSFDPFSS
jgi:hypothetical protein